MRDETLVRQVSQLAAKVRLYQSGFRLLEERIRVLETSCTRCEANLCEGCGADVEDGKPY